MFMLAFTSPTSGFPLFFARSETGGGVYVLPVAAIMGNPASVSFLFICAVGVERDTPVAFSVSSYVETGAWSSSCGSPTTGTSSTDVSVYSGVDERALRTHAKRAPKCTSNAITSATVIKAIKKSTLATVSTAASAGVEIAEPNTPACVGNAISMSPRLESKNIPMLTSCTQPKFRSNDLNINTASKMSESGSNKYPTPRSQERES